MEVNTVTNNSQEHVIEVKGRVDSSCAAEFERLLMEQLDQTESGAGVVLDLAKLSYVSSAGLRGLLKAQKKVGAGMVIKNVTDEVYEIFKMTGFTKILKIEEG